MDRRWADRPGDAGADRPAPCWQKWTRRLTVASLRHEVRSAEREARDVAGRPAVIPLRAPCFALRAPPFGRLEKAPDSTLIRLARQGSLMACDALIRRYQDRVYTIASSYVHDPQEALEITQDSLMNLFERLPQFPEHAGFYPWLCRIVVDRCIDGDRRRRSLPSLQDLASEKAVDRTEERLARCPDEALEAAGLQEQLRAAVAAVPEIDRMVVILADIEGLSSAEIAPILGCPVDSVQTRLQRGRRVIRQQLDAHLKRAKAER
jgi:RNA polymerase sigma-70 factor, ECF subfamily